MYLYKYKAGVLQAFYLKEKEFPWDGWKNSLFQQETVWFKKKIAIVSRQDEHVAEDQEYHVPEVEPVVRIRPRYARVPSWQEHRPRLFLSCINLSGYFPFFSGETGEWQQTNNKGSEVVYSTGMKFSLLFLIKE